MSVKSIALMMSGESLKKLCVFNDGAIVNSGWLGCANERLMSDKNEPNYAAYSKSDCAENKYLL